MGRAVMAIGCYDVSRLTNKPRKEQIWYLHQARSYIQLELARIWKGR